jgi:NADH dehydrogenase
LLHWAVSFLGRGRSQRATTQQQLFSRTAEVPPRRRPSPTVARR